jgi:serine acetyltransferase
MIDVVAETVPGAGGAELAVPEMQEAGKGAKALLLQVSRYLTNDVVAHIPSYRLRHAWYRRVVGIKIGPGAALGLGQYIHTRGRSRPARPGILIGARTTINRGCCLDGRGGLAIGDDVSISPGVWLLTDGHARGHDR